MPLVPAGDETGEYYIVVCGLPWNTSWQKLKDFARDQQPDGTYIEIDHAMIYPQNQTNGWVRVKGKENFLRALGMTPSSNCFVLIEKPISMAGSSTIKP